LKAVHYIVLLMNSEDQMVIEPAVKWVKMY
jgi:hypothetical protein